MSNSLRKFVSLLFLTASLKPLTDVIIEGSASHLKNHNLLYRRSAPDDFDWYAVRCGSLNFRNSMSSLYPLTAYTVGQYHLDGLLWQPEVWQIKPSVGLFKS